MGKPKPSYKWTLLEAGSLECHRICLNKRRKKIQGRVENSKSESTEKRSLELPGTKKKKKKMQRIMGILVQGIRLG